MKKLPLSETAPLPRLSAKEVLILQLLIGSFREMYGLELVRESDGKIARGTVYVTLSRMEDKGLVSSRPEPTPPRDGGLPRRMYQPTGFGCRVFDAWQAAQQHWALRVAR